ncbi:MAG: hypothetical protein IT480_01090 [Gammaproteobacteria bacterium]|nr:hypothetical protein [Gammaproteobacteria bacterium]
MGTFARVLSVAFVLLGAGIPMSIEAQAPVPPKAARLTMKWLKSLTVNPAAVRAGMDITVTLALQRAPPTRLKVDLELVGAQPDEGVQYLDCMGMASQVYVERGTRQSSFTIYTGVASVGTRSPTRTSRIYTLNARYGAEIVPATFTVITPCLLSPGN